MSSTTRKVIGAFTCIGVYLIHAKYKYDKAHRVTCDFPRIDKYFQNPNFGNLKFDDINFDNTNYDDIEPNCIDWGDP